MKWIKTSENKPKEGLHEGIMPYLICYANDLENYNDVLSIAYMYDDEWLDWDTQNPIDEPDYYAVISKLPL